MLCKKKKKPDMKATWSTFNLKKVMFHTPDVAYMHLQDLKKSDLFIYWAYKNACTFTIKI